MVMRAGGARPLRYRIHPFGIDNGRARHRSCLGSPALPFHGPMAGKATTVQAD